MKKLRRSPGRVVNGRTANGEGAPRTKRARREEPAEDQPPVGEKSALIACPANPLRQRPAACRPRVGEGRAQAQTVAAPASGRPAASPHSRPTPRLAGRPDSPSRAVPMSWSSRALICAWADMVAGGDDRDVCNESSQTSGRGGGGGSGDDEGWSRRPRAHSVLPFAGDVGRKCVSACLLPTGKCSFWAGGCGTRLWRGLQLGGPRKLSKGQNPSLL